MVLDKSHLFRAYDVRGVFGNEITPEMMFHIGIAVGKIGKKDFSDSCHVYVGYDIRQTSQLLAFSFVSGLTSQGIKVTYSNTSFPFGVVMYSGLQSNADFTAFITASHLPADWNGIKLYYGDGVGFAESKIIEIRDEFLSLSKQDIPINAWNSIQKITVQQYFDAYVSYLKKNLEMVVSIYF